MHEWVYSLLIGVVIVGLIGVIYSLQTARIKKLEDAEEKRPKPDDILGHGTHLNVHKDNMKELKEEYLESKFSFLHSKIEDMDRRFSESVRTVTVSVQNVTELVATLNKNVVELLRKGS